MRRAPGRLPAVAASASGSLSVLPQKTPTLLAPLAVLLLVQAALGVLVPPHWQPQALQASANTAGNSTAAFVSLSAYPLARCLDGSPSGYYIRAATAPAAADSWLFLLDGGGVCTTEADCLSRSRTALGSSRAWPASWALNTTDLTTPDPRNPFAAFNMVYLQYCDGSMHSGARTALGESEFGVENGF